MLIITVILLTVAGPGPAHADDRQPAKSHGKEQTALMIQVAGDAGAIGNRNEVSKQSLAGGGINVEAYAIPGKNDGFEVSLGYGRVGSKPLMKLKLLKGKAPMLPEGHESFFYGVDIEQRPQVTAGGLAIGFNSTNATSSLAVTLRPPGLSVVKAIDENRTLLPIGIKFEVIHEINALAKIAATVDAAYLIADGRFGSADGQYISPGIVLTTKLGKIFYVKAEGIVDYVNYTKFMSQTNSYSGERESVVEKGKSIGTTGKLSVGAAY